jgi:hypothetical protein
VVDRFLARRGAAASGSQGGSPGGSQKSGGYS